MCKKKGSLSINSENIFPIIKKWLYSDHDIFFRELISNGCDAVTKLNKLAGMGEYDLPEDHKDTVTVIADEKEKTLRFIDTGIGMTADEVEEYICQIAFSGATDFLEKYKDKTNEDQIIGHFGLGFYSAFMVADRVTIDTLSYKEGAQPVHWECDGGTEYDMTEGTRKEVGTEIVLYLNEDSLEFAKEYRAREVISKYCSFMPVEIFLFTAEQWDKYQEELATETVETVEEEKPAEAEEKAEEKAEGEDSGTKEDEKAEEKKEEYHPERVSISDTHPLWTKRPGDCTDEEYKEFYRKVFMDFKEPLFWIHLNMDYPFNLKGILYFPKINNEYDTIEGTIKLYNNRVFIADNIKEVIPEYLLLLKGVIDCPDLPLNVSRSALQNDGFVKKVRDYITKKVADKLNGMFKTDRENYEKYWDDIHPFIKFGCLKDEKFYEKMSGSLLFKNLEGKYLPLSEINEREDKDIAYVTDEVQQSQYIKMYKDAGMDAIYLTHNIDSPFITMLEQKNAGLKFHRIDAEIKQQLKGEQDAEALKDTTEKLQQLFREQLGNEHLQVEVQDLKDEKISAMITLSEQSRRMQEMMKMYGMGDMGSTENTLVLNANNALVKYVLENPESEHVSTICHQLYDLALIAHEPLPADEMAAFVERSNEIMMLLTK
ncbi:molecular chaperone HtpG [Lachnospiraceae bacterium CLA-AA-H215]|uniref:Molecular chaperone HtpG n=1 Tax=Hominifimenecus microfluidus TaxID=2885348 RepID=A0AAE3E7W1_9FIRM|nr:molecular chaperone HtpG [Hominifimenecus microfluidus]MCC2229753.1 molecular chaperone HtpG [Hominifimenecus microfluidus]